MGPWLVRYLVISKGLRALLLRSEEPDRKFQEVLRMGKCTGCGLKDDPSMTRQRFRVEFTVEKTLREGVRVLFSR